MDVIDESERPTLESSSNVNLLQDENQFTPPHSSEGLKMDSELKLSDENFENSLQPSKLNTEMAYPNVYELAQFASKAYTKEYYYDYVIYGDGDITNDNDKIYYKHNDYEKQLELDKNDRLKGWKLLTTASNKGSRNSVNGYFGVAFWHSNRQQVAIAHRGTDPDEFAALWTDSKGIFLNKLVAQMNSAATFADKMNQVLNKLNEQSGVNFQLSFTGHSLGGWLAQITTFTTKYLKPKPTRRTFLDKFKKVLTSKESNKLIFQKNDNPKEGYHAHTVVFDSPGCKAMLSKMRNNFDVRYRRSINLNSLDITSYLSAPNRFNTCNKHLGTIYRIFIDLSNMSWLEENTAKYNLATHDMDKILEVFNPETGQVYKDNKLDKLKIEEVIDWPISSIPKKIGSILTFKVLDSDELEKFFKWANRLNQYNPKIGKTKKPLTINGYYEIRYQTKDFDEQLSSLNVFNQCERQFLECYHWLRGLSESSKLETLLSTVSNANNKESTRAQLGHFEIKGDTIHCENAEALQRFIPYVKRLIQSSPGIENKTKEALSSFKFDTRKEVYKHETAYYLKEINIDENPLDFKEDIIKLGQFLRNPGERVWQQVVEKNTLIVLTKVYKIFKKIQFESQYEKYKNSYTVLKLKQLLNVSQLTSLSGLLNDRKTTHHLLIVECKSNDQINNEAAEKLFSDLFDVSKKKSNIKIILITQQNDNLSKFFREKAKETLGDNKYIEPEDKGLSWDEIEPVSQEALLKKMPVKFQGEDIYLDQLIDITQKELMNSIPPVILIEKLIEKNPLFISEKLPESMDYDENYYIPRTFSHQIAIKEDIFRAEKKPGFPDLLARTERKFKQLCQQYRETNIHWLESESGGKVIWQQSQGSLEELRKYIDTSHPPHYYPSNTENLNDFLQQAQRHKVMLISDTVGMGKSTVLTYLSKKIKAATPALWVVRFDLRYHVSALSAHTDEKKKKIKKPFTLISAVDFLSEELKLKPDLEQELFKQCFKMDGKVKVALLFDGFDEISPTYGNTVLNLLQVLKNNEAAEQLWVTTRPNMRKELENNLQQFSYTLEPFSPDDQIDFLYKFWKKELNLPETSQEQLNSYAKELIEKLTKSINDRGKKLTGTPLQTKMLADIYKKMVKEFYQSNQPTLELPEKFDLIGLYEDFVKNKYVVYEEKSGTRNNDEGARERREILLKILEKVYQNLALPVVFSKQEVMSLRPQRREDDFPDEMLNRIGIVQIQIDNKLYFIHQTFAEYFSSIFLVNQLKEQNQHQEVQDFFLNEILLGEDYQVIRAFLNGLLKKEEFKLSEENSTLKHYGNRIDELWKNPLNNSDGKMLHRAVIEGNTHIISFLLDCLKTGEHTDTLNKLFIAKDNIKRTAFFLATCCQVEALEKLWDWGNQAKLSPKKMLIDNKDENGSTVFLIAAWGKQVGVFDKLWELGKKELSSEDFKELLLDRDNRGQTVWHQAAKNGYVEVLEKLWEWGKETLSPEDFKNRLLLAKDNGELSAWHFAAWGGQVGVLEKLCKWSEETPSLKDFKEDFKNKLLLDTDNCGQTAWHQAAKNGYIEVLEVLKKLWEQGKETLSPEDFKEDFKNKLLLAGDNNKRTTFLLAADNGHIEVLKKLWKWCEETLSPEDLKNKLLLAGDDSKQTAFLLAAEKGHVELLGKLLEWSQTTLNPQELKEIMRSALFLVAEKGHVELLDKLFERSQTLPDSQEFNKKLLLDDKDNFNRTIWSRAIEKGHAGVLEKLWGWGEKLEINQKELKERLLDKGRHRNAWRRAVMTGRAEVFDELLEWSQAKLSSQELKELLIVSDIPNSWDRAMENGHLGLLEKLWEWSKETLNPQVLKEMLLNRYELEQTAFHLTVKFRKVAALEKLWDWGNQAKLSPKELKDWISHPDMYGRTALEFARIYTQGSIIYIEKEKKLEIVNLLNRYSSEAEERTIQSSTDNLSAVREQSEHTLTSSESVASPSCSTPSETP